METVPTVEFYHAPGSRSDRVKMLLELTGQTYTQHIVDTRRDEHKTDEYLTVNPFGVVPGLRIGGVPVVESAAQLMILADLDPANRFAPAFDAPARLLYTQWMIMIPASLEPMVLPAIGDPASETHLASAGRALEIQSSFFVGPYCLGDQLSAVDVMTHWSLRFLDRIGLLTKFPAWRAYQAFAGERLDWASLN